MLSQACINFFLVLNILWKSLEYSNWLVSHILPNNFYFQQQKEIYLGLKQLESK